jgi:anti-sigma regulatory factor (Ser/Thr protein kinase)
VSVTYTWELPRDSTAPAQGRWHVRGVTSNDREAVDAELVVTELITNAWKHGAGDLPITLRVEVRDDALHLEVCGESASDPVSSQQTAGSDSGGRGLMMIDGLADSWGYERNGSNLCVWADLPHLD